MTKITKSVTHCCIIIFVSLDTLASDSVLSSPRAYFITRVILANGKILHKEITNLCFPICRPTLNHIINKNKIIFSKKSGGFLCKCFRTVVDGLYDNVVFSLKKPITKGTLSF